MSECNLCLESQLFLTQLDQRQRFFSRNINFLTDVGALLYIFHGRSGRAKHSRSGVETNVIKRLLPVQIHHVSVNLMQSFKKLIFSIFPKVTVMLLIMPTKQLIFSVVINGSVNTLKKKDFIEMCLLILHGGSFIPMVVLCHNESGPKCPPKCFWDFFSTTRIFYFMKVVDLTI